MNDWIICSCCGNDREITELWLAKIEEKYGTVDVRGLLPKLRCTVCNHKESVLKSDIFSAIFIITWLHSVKKKSSSLYTLAAYASAGADTVGQASRQGIKKISDTLHQATRAEKLIEANVGAAIGVAGKAVATESRWMVGMAKMGRALVGIASNELKNAVDRQSEKLHADGKSTAARSLKVTGDIVVNVGTVAGKLIFGAVELTYQAVALAGDKTAEKATLIGGMAAGVVTGTATTLGGVADSLIVTEDEIHAVQRQIETARFDYATQRETYQMSLAEKFNNRKARLLEQFTISGLVLGEILAGKYVPSDVKNAYEAAFPHESLIIGFREKVASLDSGDELNGLVSAVKGKLFEMKYVGELNDGGLPDGWHAQLADSATQPGWDLQIINDHGVLQELISAKATDHMGYVTDALERYPDIDIVTTSEVYAALAGTPEGAHLIDGGINNVEMTGAVSSAAAGHSAGLESTLVSALALGPAAYKHFVNSDQSMAQKTKGFSAHIGATKTAAFAGKSAMLLVPYWPVAFLAAAGVSIVARVGNNKREQLSRLEALRDQILDATLALKSKQQRLQIGLNHAGTSGQVAAKT